MAEKPPAIRALLQSLPRVVATIILLLPLPGFIGAIGVSAEEEWKELPSSTREFAFVERHLEGSFSGYSRFDVLAPQFGVVALSHMAAGLLNVYLAEPARQDRIAKLLDEVVRRAQSAEVSPFEKTVDLDTQLDDHNLYWSHLALAIGIRRYVACKAAIGPCTASLNTDELQTKIVQHLVARTLASKLFHAPSYPKSAMWPADQSVTLAAIKLYDVTKGTNLLQDPLRGYVRTMQTRQDPETGLYQSSVSSFPDAIIPRGCALSWISLYMSQFAPSEASDQYRRYRDSYAHDVLGVGGFREWPVGRERDMDGDSGPIVFGVGTSATGLGLGAARIFRDVDRYTTIRRTVMMFGLPSWIPSHGYNAAPLLGEAILFHGRTARGWFAPSLDPAKPVTSSTPKTPWFAITVLVLNILALLSVAWRWWCAFRRPPPNPEESFT